MNLKIYKIKDSEDEKWDNLVFNSFDSSVFASSFYLKSSNENFDRYFIYKGNQLKAGIYFPINNKEIIKSDLIIYSGILFYNDLNQKLVNKLNEKFIITEKIIEFLTLEYKKIDITIFNIFDLRPFLWKNYQIKESKKFRINIEYTSILNIEELFLKKDDYNNNLFMNMDNIRQKDIRKANANKNHYIFNKHGKIKPFIKSFKDMMLKNKVKLTTDFIKNMENLLKNLIQSSKANIFELIDKKEKKILYYCVFVYFKNEAYYLFGAGDRNIMTRFSTTYCLWESFKFMSSLGISKINLEGVNSPNRGQYKMSLGGDLKQYYNLKFL